MLDNDEPLNSGGQKKDRSNEKKTSKRRVITVQDAVWRPNIDLSKEKKTSKGYAGTVQDIEWRRSEEPEYCSREQICYWYRVKGEYEN